MKASSVPRTVTEGLHALQVSQKAPSSRWMTEMWSQQYIRARIKLRWHSIDIPASFDKVTWTSELCNSQYIKWWLAKAHWERFAVRVTHRPGPYCTLTPQCHCWCLISCGPTRHPQRTLFLHLTLLLPHCHWWSSQKLNWLCVCSGQSCRWWCRGHPSRRWFQGSSQSADCPSLGWRA